MIYQQPYHFFRIVKHLLRFLETLLWNLQLFSGKRKAHRNLHGMNIHFHWKSFRTGPLSQFFLYSWCFIVDCCKTSTKQVFFLPFVPSLQQVVPQFYPSNHQHIHDLAVQREVSYSPQCSFFAQSLYMINITTAFLVTTTPRYILEQPKCTNHWG